MATPYIIRTTTNDGCEFRVIDPNVVPEKKTKEKEEKKPGSMNYLPFVLNPIFPPIKLWPYSVPNRYV